MTALIHFIQEDATVLSLVDPSCSVEQLATGFEWTEGPTWNPVEKCLYFSDVVTNKLYRWTEKEGVSLFLSSSGYSGLEPFVEPGYKGLAQPGSNGLALDKQGRLIICEHGNRRLTRLEKSGEKTILADRYQGLRINSPNDVICLKNGEICFTDPPYGLPNLFDDKSKELPYQGVYRIDQQGEMHLLTKDILLPNGLGVSPDEKTFYVSNSDPKNPVWYAFDFDGEKLTNQRLFASSANWIEGREGVPDGFCLDVHGNLFAAGPGGFYILDKMGKMLAFIDFGHATSNCIWGDDGSSLYLTTGDSICRLRVKTKGFLSSIS